VPSRQASALAPVGARPTGGGSAIIEGACRQQDRPYQVVIERSPRSNCLTTQAFTAPLAAVRIARADLPMSFGEKGSRGN